MNDLLSFVIVIFFSLPTLPFTEAKTGGFSIDLIHRDSPLSPFYNHSFTPEESLKNAALRSISRLNHFRQSSIDEKAIESMVIPGEGDYLMKLSIGTPPVEFYAAADTGSDLIWIQCMPCMQCYPQDSPIFNPAKSSTYRELSCGSKPCTKLSRKTCSKTNGCQYYNSYGDGSYTAGDLATETFVFRSTNGEAAAFPTSVFGCGRRNSGAFTGSEAGLVGLGGGPLSLVSQLGAEIEHKFSYCLHPRSASSTSKLRFGMEAIISGEGIVSTPLVPKSPSTFYYLTLEGISIGGKTLPSTLGEGNIIYDSGTTLTMLESSFYNDLEAVIKEAIPLEPAEAPSPFSLCYATASSNRLPDMMFHFTGADLLLHPLNTFMETNNLNCLSIIPSDGSLSIFGNVAQMNFQVEYDLEEKKVSFAPADCTK
ncbi:hypothetical protein L1049_023140 [Liquidambar formosana]|uniref:Peptidase A1 domain-containing protein n=1 Tax=Liquidambar formosana TaxID=63359 RepID=A0AAP0RF44_LIQFO